MKLRTVKVAAFVGVGFLMAAGGINQVPVWTGVGQQASEAFGSCAKTIGDVNGDGFPDLAVSAPYYCPAGAFADTWAGRVDVFYGSATGPSATPDWSYVGGWRDWTYFSENLGCWAIASGDLNGDGVSDLIVGAYGSCDPSPDFGWDESSEGRVYVFYGQAGAGLPAEANWIVEGNYNAQMMGCGVACGDVNGDGFDDLIAGTPYYDIFYQSCPGRAFAWYGSATGLRTDANASGDPRPSITPDWSTEDIQYGSMVGGGMTTGDVNGDGFADVVVAEWYGGRGGRAYVYHGSASGLSPTYNALLEGDQTDELFSGSLACGDVNGDGCDDVLIASCAYDGAAGADCGRAQIFLGGPTGVTITAAWSAECDGAGAQMGWSCCAMDVNADSYADVVVGAPTYAGAGAVFIYYGSADVPSASPDLKMETNIANAGFGAWVDRAGDLLADGKDDLIVGATGAESTGKVYVYNVAPAVVPPNPTPTPTPIPTPSSQPTVDSSSGGGGGGGGGGCSVASPRSAMMDGSSLIGLLVILAIAMARKRN